MSGISLDEVTKVYPNGVKAVDALSLEIAEGEFCVLVGPSGCGKTTSLKMVNRLIEPTSGRILIDGVDAASRDVTELRRSIGYVIQQVGLFPHETVRANVATLPIMLYPGMKIGQLCFFRLSSPAENPYGSAAYGSHYQGQLSTLSKHFRTDHRPDQLTFTRSPGVASASRRAAESPAPADPAAVAAPEQPRLESL